MTTSTVDRPARLTRTKERGPTQAEMLLALLRERGTRGVTPLLALDRFGSLRLAAVVYDLKASGYSITTNMVATDSGKHVACYVLNEARPYTQEEFPW